MNTQNIRIPSVTEKQIEFLTQVIAAPADMHFALFATTNDGLAFHKEIRQLIEIGLLRDVTVEVASLYVENMVGVLSFLAVKPTEIAKGMFNGYCPDATIN